MAHEGLMGRAALPLAKQHAGNRWPRGCFLHGLGCFPEKAEPCGNGVAGHILWLDQGNHEVLRFNELFAGTLGFWDVCKHMPWRSSSSSWFFLVQSWVWNAGCVALIKWMVFLRFLDTVWHSILILRRNTVFIWLLCLELRKCLGWELTEVWTGMDQVSLSSADRGWMGDGFLGFRDRDEKMSKGHKI